VIRGDVDADELAALVECLGHEKKAIQRPAAEAAAALAERGVPVEPALLTALGTGPFRQRWGVAFALSRLADPPTAILPVLVEALGVDDGDVRWASARILVTLAVRIDILPTLASLAIAGNPAQRKMALYCLRDLEVRSDEAERTVVAALQDADVGVRLAAIGCLPRLASDRAGAAAALLRALDRGSEHERRAVAAALGTLGEDSDAVRAALTEAAAGADVGLRRAATRSLRLLSREK
jgi:hypothetical protein